VTALDQFLRHWKRKDINVRSSVLGRFAGVKLRIAIAQIAARDGVRQGGARFPAVPEKLRFTKRFVPGLVMHVLAAACKQEARSARQR
jgi:hypothetical protein